MIKYKTYKATDNISFREDDSIVKYWSTSVLTAKLALTLQNQIVRIV